MVKKAGGFGVPSKNILVKVHSAALNPVDLVLYNSSYYPFQFAFGEQGIGRDYSGVIVDIGEEAASKTGLKAGDEVVGLYQHPFGKGSVAEYILLDSTAAADSAITLKPKNLNFNEAASFPLVYGTADNVTLGHDLKGKKILVIGGSTSVGKYVIQLGNLKGAKTIVTVNSSRSNELVTKLGSTNQIDYTQHKSILEPVLKSVKDSGAYDYIYDAKGNSDLFPHISNILKPKSTGAAYVSVVGDAKFDYGSAHILGSFLSNVYAGIRTLKSVLGLGFNYKFVLLVPSKRWIDEAKSLFESGKLEVAIDSVHKFENFQDAVDRIRLNKASGKVVVQISS